MSAGYSGLPAERFMEVEAARRHYGLEEHGSLFASEVDRQLYEDGVASIEMPIAAGDFETLLDGYEICIGECPDLLKQTFHPVDNRFGNEAGHVRRNKKYDRAGRQTQDGKNFIHFNEHASRRWREEFADAPKVLRDFLAAGCEVHEALIRVSENAIGQLEETHPNITRAYFPGNPGTVTHSQSFMRLISYDAYRVDERIGEVAKAHYDISGATIQAYADAPGFWGSAEGHKGQRLPYDTSNGEAFFFMGSGHRKLYGPGSRIRPLYHGVDRIVPADAAIVPERHSVILFINCPLVNCRTKPADTLPELEHAEASKEQRLGKVAITY